MIRSTKKTSLRKDHSKKIVDLDLSGLKLNFDHRQSKGTSPMPLPKKKALLGDYLGGGFKNIVYFGEDFQLDGLKPPTSDPK